MARPAATPRARGTPVARPHPGQRQPVDAQARHIGRQDLLPPVLPPTNMHRHKGQAALFSTSRLPPQRLAGGGRALEPRSAPSGGGRGSARGSLGQAAPSGGPPGSQQPSPADTALGPCPAAQVAHVAGLASGAQPIAPGQRHSKAFPRIARGIALSIVRRGAFKDVTSPCGGKAFAGSGSSPSACLASTTAITHRRRLGKGPPLAVPLGEGSGSPSGRLAHRGRGVGRLLMRSAGPRSSRSWTTE